MTSANHSSSAPGNDEIDITALVQGLWGQRWLIAIVTLVVTLGAALYAFLSKPVYEARIGVLPPVLSDITGFNIARSENTGLAPFSVTDVYSVFTRNLRSEGSRNQFFKNVYLPSLDNEQRSGSRDELYKKFGKLLKVQLPAKGQIAHTVIVKHSDPLKAADWAQYYLDQVTRQSTAEVLRNTQREVEVKSKQIQGELNTLRKFAEIHKNDRLAKLREALTVAEAVGLEAPPVIGGQISQQLSAFMNGDLMYMRGTRALRSEIEVLEGRTADEPFIPSLRYLEQQHTTLQNALAPSMNVSVSRLDGPIEIPDAPVKPRKALILVLGVLLGGMLGFLIALVRLMLNGYPNNSQESVSLDGLVSAGSR
ncbi:chain length determinant protein [Microbulbifer sp. NBRC 101763]|uniref:LPS O-antigen chain length determinant protein WzzB n=1 Tax=unclassified Microbulbifer TaxID=2619833 RepID=UPI0030B0EA08